MLLPLPFEDINEDQIEQLEYLRGMRCESNDPHSGRAKKIYHITREVNWAIIHQ
jgi:hypothetical protein